MTKDDFYRILVSGNDKEWKKLLKNLKEFVNGK